MRNRSKYSILGLLCLMWVNTCYSQLGGERSFEFLNLPHHAKLAGLGGVNITGADPNMGLSNPALIRTDFDKHLAINYLNYVADINLTSLAYTQEFKKVGLLSFGIQYMSYGDFDGFDAAGLPTGSFNANEYAITVGKSHTLGNFTMGANMKFAGSVIDEFSSSALLFDFGGVFIHPEKEFTAGLLLKNIGFLLSDYTGTASSELPFDVQLGMTFKPQYMPFRFSVTAYNLVRDDFGYVDNSGNSTIVEEASTFDKIFRRITLGTELILSDNLQIRAGYNHLIREELRLEEVSGGSGFSLGLMFRVKAFEFAYTRAFYHVAGGGNYFTLISNFNTLFKKTTEEDD